MSYDVMKCSVCGTVTETDGNQVCYECWCEADLKQHNLEQKKKEDTGILIPGMPVVAMEEEE